MLNLLRVSIMIWYLFDFMKKKLKIEKSDFLNENDFYKTKVVNLILKYFLNDWYNFEIQFFQKTHFTRNLYEIIMLVLDTFFKIYTLHGDFDASRRRMPHLQWRVRKLSCIELSQGYELVKCWPSVNSP